MKFKRLEIVFLVIGFVLFFLRATLSLDPDFGWSLQMGRLIILHDGVPKTDPFSYTMPSYPYVDHEWLADVAIAKLYPVIGMVGLALVSAFLFVLSLVFSLIRLESARRRFGSMPLAPVILIFFAFAFFRVQVVSWFLFSLLIFIILDEKRFRRFRFFLPVLFLLWSNLHGGFAAGIGTLLVVVLVRFWDKRRLLIGDFIVFLASVGATLINPYGLRLWWEVWMLMSDNAIHWTIAEWLPSLFFANSAFWIFSVLSLIGVLRYFKKFKTSELIIYFIFLILSVSSLKQIPLWLIVALSMTINCLFFFSQEVSLIELGTVRFSKAYRAFCLIIAIFIIITFNYESLFVLSEAGEYPKNAVAFLKNQSGVSRIFSVYGWGGYLIWKMPGKKLFIDGRMPDWRRSIVVSGESTNAMEEYEKIEGGKESFESAAKKYKIDIVLLPRERKIVNNGFAGRMVNWYGRADVFLTKLFNKNRFFDLGRALQKEGYKEIYQDNNSVIYLSDQKQL